MNIFGRENVGVLPGKAQRSFLRASKGGHGHQPVDLSTPSKGRQPFTEIDENTVSADQQHLELGDLQFCANDDDAVEEEVFFGDVTELERKKTRKFHKRRTVVFFPGFRKDPHVMRRTINQSNKEGKLHAEGNSIHHVDQIQHSQGLDLRTERKEDKTCNTCNTSGERHGASSYSVSDIAPLDLTIKSMDENSASLLNNAGLSGDLSVEMDTSSAFGDKKRDCTILNVGDSKGVLDVLDNYVNCENLQSFESSDSHSTLNNARVSDTDGGWPEFTKQCSPSQTSSNETASNAGSNGSPKCLKHNETCSETLNRSFIEYSADTVLSEDVPVNDTDISTVRNTLVSHQNLHRYCDVTVPTPVETTLNRSFIEDFADSTVGAPVTNTNISTISKTMISHQSPFIDCNVPVPPPVEVLQPLDIQHVCDAVSQPDLNVGDRFSAFSTYTPTKQTTRKTTEDNTSQDVDAAADMQRFQRAIKLTSPNHFFPTILFSDSPISTVTLHAQPHYFGSLSPFKKSDNACVFSPFDGLASSKVNSQEPHPEKTGVKSKTQLSSCSQSFPKSATVPALLSPSLLCQEVACKQIVSYQFPSTNGSTKAEILPESSDYAKKPEDEESDVLKTAGSQQNKLQRSVITSSVVEATGPVRFLAQNSCNQQGEELKSSPSSASLASVEPTTSVDPTSSVGRTSSVDRTSSDDPNSADSSSRPVLTMPDTAMAPAETKVSNEEYARLLEQKKFQLKQLRQKREVLQEKLKQDSSYAKLSQLHSPKPTKLPCDYPGIPQMLPKSACVERPALSLSQKELDAVTKLHTICNSKTVAKILEKQDPLNLLKDSTVESPRIKWRHDLVDHITSKHSPSKAEEHWCRPILSKKSLSKRVMSKSATAVVYSPLLRTNTLGHNS